MTVLWYATVDELQGTLEDGSIGWLEKKHKSCMMNPKFLERLPAKVFTRGEEMASVILGLLPTHLWLGSQKRHEAAARKDTAAI